jgi:hypothetical protein
VKPIEACACPLAGLAHDDMFWANRQASLNIFDMSVTLDVSQPPIGWLKAASFSNTLSMSMTLDVSHVPGGGAEPSLHWDTALFN